MSVRHAAVSAFVVAHAVAIFVWTVPFDPAPLSTIRAKLKPILSSTGLAQKWNLFAPVPSSFNCFVDARITYQNGTVSWWHPPDEPYTGHTWRYARYRKFLYDRIRTNKFSVYWPDVARYIARQMNQPSNPPRIVDLVRHWSEITLPPLLINSSNWNSEVFFTYRVHIGDL